MAGVAATSSRWCCGGYGRGVLISQAVDRAGVYDRWYVTGLGAAAHGIERSAIAGLALPASGERVLDAGCGTGLYLGWLALGLIVTGIDRDPEMLAAARRKAPAARLVEGDLVGLPFGDGEFDLALAVTVFCFLSGDERRRAARELVRVVRPGGRVVVGELARASLWAAPRRVKAWRGSRTWSRARFTTASELERLLRLAGAKPVRSLYCLYLPPLDRPFVTRRAMTIERAGSWLGPVGAAFVATRADAGGRAERVTGSV